MELKEALIEIEMYDFYLEIAEMASEEELENLFKIRRFKKGEIINFHEEASGRNGHVWNIISGRAKQIFYPSSNAEFVYEMNKGQWIGIPGTVKGTYPLSDLEIVEDIEVLVFPLGKIMRERPDMMAGIWEKIARVMVEYFFMVTESFIDRTSLSKEAYFLKMLAENDYRFDGVSTRILSENTGINLRTLQRLISDLEKKKIIIRDRSTNTIWVDEYEKFDDYLDSLD